jgi:hypothetical protein
MNRPRQATRRRIVGRMAGAVLDRTVLDRMVLGETVLDETVPEDTVAERRVGTPEYAKSALPAPGRGRSLPGICGAEGALGGEA